MPNVGKVISGALLDTINNHGPITAAEVGSAEKRVRRALSGCGLLRDPGEPTEDLIGRLREQASDDAQYVALLERHVVEGLRVNVGLMIAAREARDVR